MKYPIGIQDFAEIRTEGYVYKDSIKACNVCEYRYMCTDCRAFIENPSDEFSKPLKCGYDPYTRVWSDWATDETKINIFLAYKKTAL